MKNLFAKRRFQKFSSLHNESYATRLRREFAPGDFLPSVPTALLSWFLTIIFSVSLAALIFLGEKVSPLRWAGVVLIMLGAALISYSEQIKEKPRPADSVEIKP